MVNKSTQENLNRKKEIVNNIEKVDNIPMFTWIDLNPTELCNRKCEFCPRYDESVYPNQSLHMSVELVRKIAEELKLIDYKGGVTFSGFGEPMLNPNITDFPLYFDKDTRLELVTNGDLLTPKNIKLLIDNGLDYFVISMYDGEHQIKHFKDMFDSVGVTNQYYTLRDRWNKEDDFGLILTNRAGMINTGNQRKVNLKDKCFYLAYSLTIDWNGDVLPCCHTWDKKIIFGNLNYSTLWDVWISTTITKYRKKLIVGDRSLPPCNKCNTMGCLHGSNHAKEWSQIYDKK